MQYTLTVLFIASACSAYAHLIFKSISISGWTGLISGQGLLAFALYGLGFLLYFYALKYVPISIACQFTAVTYILICLGAMLIFHETVTSKQLIGMVGVFLGMILILGGN